MSLLDTINEARKEAQEANAPLRSSKGGKDGASGDGQDEKRTGFSKRSVSRARPTREAAAGVRVEPASSGAERSSRTVSPSKPVASMSKEERKQYRREQRDEGDRRNYATQVLLRQQPGYKKSQRVWWGLLGSGLGATVISWALSTFYPSEVTSSATPVAIVAFILLVAAYALIISAFVYDWRVVRPMRKASEAASNGMTKSKVDKVIAAEAEDIKREKEEKAARKAARKEKRGSE